jgi:hypothetical protein
MRHQNGSITGFGAMLGPGTAKLGQVVSCNGPVTAACCVDKVSFSTFGDTVNTASRMESNGAKGRIQVSKLRPIS